MARTERSTNFDVPSRMPVGIPGLHAIDRQRAAENFPVALRVLPQAVRDDLIAIYGYARLVDDIGDEYAGDRLAALDWLEHDVLAAPGDRAEHPVVRRLTPTIRARGLPLQPFLDLIEANRRDQTVHRYSTFGELLDYCKFSATPVGRLVLAVFGVDDAELVQLSDDVCSALQVIEHLQDVGEDYHAGRVYLAKDDLDAFHLTDDDLGADSASYELRCLIAFQWARARQLLRSGRPLTRRLHGWSRPAIAGFVAGGEAALDAILAAQFDVLGVDCKPRRARVAWHALSLLVGKAD
ncbi:MAG: squalene synthase HpnC [Ilumatobacteraceae bacterium]